MESFLVTEQRSAEGPRIRSLLRKAHPKSVTHATGFRDVTRFDVEGEVDDIARETLREGTDRVGHLTLLQAEVESTCEAIEAASRRLDHL